jgi:hypothetical protein
MTTEVISLELPISVYNKLQELVTEEQSDPVTVITHLVTVAHQHRSWLRDLATLRQQIQQEGGLQQVGSTKEEVIERLRQTRREIFEAEYAHLYR